MLPEMPASHADGRVPGRSSAANRLADVAEYLPHRGRLGNEGKDPHLGPTLGTGQRECRIDAGQQYRPEVACRGASQGFGGLLARDPQGRCGLRRDGLFSFLPTYVP